MKLGVIKMKVKGKNIYNSEQALEFAKSVRGQYILSQALTIASNILESYEIEFDEYDKDFDLIENKKDHQITKWNTLSARCEPSNRSDMNFLLAAFPLYMIHETDIWVNEGERRREEDENSEE